MNANPSASYWEGEPSTDAASFGRSHSEFTSAPLPFNRHFSGYEAGTRLLKGFGIDLEVAAHNTEVLLDGIWGHRQELLGEVGSRSTTFDSVATFLGNHLCELRPYAHWINMGGSLEVGDAERRYPVHALLEAIITADASGLASVKAQLDSWVHLPPKKPRV